MTLHALRRLTQRADTALHSVPVYGRRPRQIARGEEVVFPVYKGPLVAAARQLNEHWHPSQQNRRGDRNEGGQAEWAIRYLRPRSSQSTSTIAERRTRGRSIR
jgi:hypothetical protein